uniref:Uncharacterized protein n=1 Tax=Macrostomum lignano TaxID=282301 RepID=A0A1I8FD55_9PLAT
MSTKSSHRPSPGQERRKRWRVKADESLMATIMSLIKKYDRLLNERPLLTKAATSTRVLFMCGPVSCFGNIYELLLNGR